MVPVHEFLPPFAAAPGIPAVTEALGAPPAHAPVFLDRHYLAGLGWRGASTIGVGHSRHQHFRVPAVTAEEPMYYVRRCWGHSSRRQAWFAGPRARVLQLAVGKRVRFAVNLALQPELRRPCNFR